MHVGYGHDKGGNTVQLHYRGQGTNLHYFWDSGIILGQNIKLADCLNAKTYTLDELKQVKQINVVAWAEEARSFLPQEYQYGNAKVKDDYAIASARIVEEQIQKAGIRLASVLQLLFKS